MKGSSVSLMELRREDGVVMSIVGSYCNYSTSPKVLYQSTSEVL